VASSPLTLHAAPAAGFDAPFEMLDACHDRVRRMLALLQRLAVHVQDHGSDTAAREAATDLMRYFDRAAPEHHEDEERHLFPLLAQSTNPALRALVQRLQDEHLDMERQWRTLRTDLRAVRAGEAWPPGAGARAAAFVALYAAHVAAEDEHAYPEARALVSPEQARHMGCEMASRRGVPGPP
jgi:hemerythrin-like domain-containing protein